MAISENSLIVTPRGEVQLASCGYRPRMLLNILQDIEHPPTTKSYPAPNAHDVEVEKLCFNKFNNINKSMNFLKTTAY